MQRKDKKEAGFTLIEMIACLLLLSMFFLLLPRLHIMGIENTHSKGLNDWEWDVFLGQMQLEFREVISGRKIERENDWNILRFQLRNDDKVTYEKVNSNLIRKVNMRGREVILQRIEAISYKLTPQLLYIRVKDIGGEIYEGVVVRYSEIEIET
ncbi:competence type IV pilus minor pilin ComGF [Bacillus nitratireducens]|uniref:competence type IV pilus minor pilin ComGF n=1 Tax=Bacillus nitratireducens TaxID=2026193 RepID=UPI000BED566D|nr:competence type IV pilus minor pilin ComGF [Bacillus nitratireducens]PEE18010.1 competence protein ComG [Bacillus cereus]MED0905370.1 competence type IV pilus minor pilin ComGF [Bacillus nitratireducens]PFH88293.1 competence protein ComG [Bacillus cereus]PFM59084.1 competence protein ComG [Bacillus cereus]PFS14951.1 competence protein ComG [Bacillus cereus]